MFASGAKEPVRQEWPLEVIFSYAGSLQHLNGNNGVLEQLPIPGGTLASRTSDIGPKVGRIALFEISAMVDDGNTMVKFLYNRHSSHQGLISAWIQNYEHLLLEAIGRLRHHVQELTLADIPHLNVTYDGLAKLNKHRVKALNLLSVRDIEAVYPATAIQQSILITQAQRPDACYYHAVHEFSPPEAGAVDTSQICSAWQAVCAKHPAMRTVFMDSVTVNGLYDQVVLRKACPPMLFIDNVPPEDPIKNLNNLPALRGMANEIPHRLTVCKTPVKTYVKLDISQTICDVSSMHTPLLGKLIR
jgi:hypothetical protein